MPARMLQFSFSTQIVEPPTGAQIRFDHASYSSVTKLWIRYTTFEGLDAYYLLNKVPFGTDLFIQAKTDHTRVIIFDMMGDPIDKGTYFEYPVSWANATGTAFTNNEEIAITIQEPEPVTPPPSETTEPTGPLDFTHDYIVVAGPLVSLAEAKTHLRITTTAHDADVNEKTATAQDAILAYLASAANADWTPSTVPKAVKHAILLLTTHYYEHRGDDMSPTMSGATPDADVWHAIERLLMMHRDPTLA